MLDLDPTITTEVVALIKKHLPNVTIKAFGSRVNGKASTYSDLDVALIAEGAISHNTLNRLKFDLSSSDIPIMIDIVDWHTLTPEFQSAINSHFQILC